MGGVHGKAEISKQKKCVTPKKKSPRKMPRLSQIRSDVDMDCNKVELVMSGDAEDNTKENVCPSTPASAVPLRVLDLDPRSPTLEVDRTPILVTRTPSVYKRLLPPAVREEMEYMQKMMILSSAGDQTEDQEEEVASGWDSKMYCTSGKETVDIYYDEDINDSITLDTPTAVQALKAVKTDLIPLLHEVPCKLKPEDKRYCIDLANEVARMLEKAGLDDAGELLRMDDPETSDMEPNKKNELIMEEEVVEEYIINEHEEQIHEDFSDIQEMTEEEEQINEDEMFVSVEVNSPMLNPADVVTSVPFVYPEAQKSESVIPVAKINNAGLDIVDSSDLLPPASSAKLSKLVPPKTRKSISPSYIPVAKKSVSPSYIPRLIGGTTPNTPKKGSHFVRTPLGGLLNSEGSMPLAQRGDRKGYIIMSTNTPSPRGTHSPLTLTSMSNQARNFKVPVYRDPYLRSETPYQDQRLASANLRGSSLRHIPGVTNPDSPRPRDNMRTSVLQEKTTPNSRIPRPHSRGARNKRRPPTPCPDPEDLPSPVSETGPVLPESWDLSNETMLI